MTAEYFGPTKNVEAVVNELLGLESHGQEQDWEIEHADSSRIAEMLDAFHQATEPDVRCALMMLVLGSFEVAFPEGTELDPTLSQRLSYALRSDPEIAEKMWFAWLRLERSIHPARLRGLFGGTDPTGRT